MPEYQPGQAAAQSVAAEAAGQPKRLVTQELAAGLRPSLVPVGSPRDPRSPQPRAVRPSRAAAAPVLFIQRQRDLAKGETVEYTEDGDEHWGTVSELKTSSVPKVKYTVRDNAGHVHEVYEEDVEPVGKDEPLEEGEIIEDGHRARANVDMEELDCVIVKSVVELPEQFYDITVEWHGGQRLAEPFLAERVPERKVRARNREQVHAPDVKRLDKAKITHFYPKKQPAPNAGEYVGPRGGPIDITSHALGSGVYGITEPTAEHHRAAAEDAKGAGGVYSTQELEFANPLVMQNSRHSGELQTLGKTINGMAQSIQNERPKDQKADTRRVIAASVERNSADLAKMLDKVFRPAGRQVPEVSLIEKALLTFFQRYDDAHGKFVDQPVTIFLAEMCGFGGIYGDAASGINTWDRGNVAFVPPDREFPRKVRLGAGKHDIV